MKDRPLQVLVFTLSVYLLSACGQGEMTTEEHVPLIPKPPEHVLAALDAGTEIDANHPSISRFRSLLDSISAKCINDRSEITSTAIEIRGILQGKGIRISMSDLLERLNRNIPDVDGGDRYDFKLIATAFHGLSADHIDQN